MANMRKMCNIPSEIYNCMGRVQNLNMWGNFNMDTRGFVHVYANRACRGNGRPGAGAGIDVCFQNNHPLNVWTPIPDGYRATNQVAEILAVTTAAKQASSAGVRRLRIHTESKYILFSVRKWMKKWRRNGWRNAKGEPLFNKKELMEMDLALRPLKVKWTWRNFYVDQKGFVHVYTDGSCPNNGKIGATAGIGVYFEEGHPLNVSQPVPRRRRVTSNVAEILAATKAITQAASAGVKKLRIHTDSDYVKGSITLWMSNWKANGWNNAEGKPVANQKILKELDLASRQLIAVRWRHVPAHKGIFGNEMADKFANAGAAAYVE